MINEEFIESVTLKGEEWRDVQGYEGYYKVSSYGRVISLYRLVKYGSKWLPKPPIIMSDVSTPNRYNSVILKVNGKKESRQVHRLVANAFIPNPNNYPCIDHIDGNKQNNYVSNLRWCNDLQNQNNPVTREKQRHTLKENGSKFAPKAIIGINEKRGDILFYPTMCDARKDGFLQSMISECCNGNRKHHHGYKWMYKEDYDKLNTN